MPTNTGTHDISFLLAATNQSARAFGLDTIAAVLQADIAAHNALVRQMVGDFAEITTDTQRIYGASAAGEMVQVDEYGRSNTQRSGETATVGFPLHKFQYAIGWTEMWFELKTPADLARATLAAEKAHLRAIQREIKRAIFGSANYTHVDYLVDNVSYNVKRLVNADSQAIPEGPNGETFNAATHTHYDFNNGLAASAVTAAIEDVIEHGHGDRVIICIHRNDEAAFRLLTGFEAYRDPRLVFGASTTGVPETRLDMARLDNRAIGLFGAAEVWVKPWIPQAYAFVTDIGDPNKPLVMRQREQETLQGLRVAATLSAYPLVAQYMEAEYGFGVWTRTNGAVLYYAGGAGAYAVPTFS